MSAINIIIETLKNADNEATESPYWLLIDPQAVIGYLKWKDGEETVFADLDEENCEGVSRHIPNCITGPFFSRDDAENYLKSRNYEYSKNAYVYCHSGYWSKKYKDFCREIKP